ncbi:PLDc N-terminal domain-containing protein [Nonomuraea typhae]|uniref:PLDc N-terminal domain-containing protein n=1 Tax=Nonomuraea typhae TaxID=2603600 RepID=A0ABW7YRL6_9ACTN
MSRRWNELTERQRWALGVGSGLQLALLAAALIDLRRRPAAEIRGSKRMWAAIVFVNFAGPLAYFTLARRR